MKRFMVWTIALVFLFCTSGIAAAQAPAAEKKEKAAAADPAKADKKDVKKDDKKDDKKADKKKDAKKADKKKDEKKADAAAPVPPAKK
jgi:hypothetical protein